MLAGVVVGLVPMVLPTVAGMFVRIELIPGTTYLFLTMTLIPISLGVALLRSERASLKSEAAQPVRDDPGIRARPLAPTSPPWSRS